MLKMQIDSDDCAINLFSSFKKEEKKKEIALKLEADKQKKTKKYRGAHAVVQSHDPPSLAAIGALLTGTAVKNNVTGVVGYEMQGPLQYLVWYHAVGLIWITEFIFAFQQMTIAGAVVTYYFTR